MSALSGLIRSLTILPRGIPARAGSAIAIVPAGVPLGNRFKFDAVTQQQHNRSIESTSHPVEAGLDVTDHSRRNLDALNVSGVITDTPLDPTGLLGAFGVLRQRAHEQLRQLDNFFVKREPVFVATSTRVYEAMLIKSLDWSKSVGIGNAIAVTMMLEEVRIVSPIQIPTIDDLDGLLFGGEGTVDGGTQSTSATGLPAGSVA